MDNEVNSKVTIVSLDKMIYHAIFEIWYRLLKRPDEKRIFSFLKEFLDGNEIAELVFRKYREHLKLRGKLLINHRIRRIISFCKRVFSIPVLILVIHPAINSLRAPHSNSPWRLYLSGSVAMPGNRSTMLCWRRFFSYAKSLHCYFKIKHQTFLTSHFTH